MNRNRRPGRRVVITSTGLFSAMGSSPLEIADTIRHDRVHFQHPDDDPELAVCPVNDFDLRQHTGRCKDARYLNRGAAFALAAALIAVKQSGLDRQSLENGGLFAASGPNMDISGECPDIIHGRISSRDLPALFLLKFLPNTATSLISQLAGIHGENLTLGSACAASLMAIGEGFRRIRDGYLDVAVAGGGDSRLSPCGLLSYKKAGALWQGTEDPAMAYAPFDAGRKGFIPGEGGAFFVLESLDHAERRSAVIHAEIKGYGSSLDGYAMTAPRPDGIWAKKAVAAALAQAGVSPSHVDLISTHGTGTALNDSMEIQLIKDVFSNDRPRLVAFKSFIGHLASSCGAVELALCLACSENKLWPQIRNLKTPIDPDLDYMEDSGVFSPRCILVENFGFGGQNSALVVEPWTR